MIDQTITLKRLELHVLDLPQKSVFKSGIGIRKSKETLLVKWIDKDGRVGYGECSCRPDPYYSAEFLKAAVLLIQDFIAPKLQSSQAYDGSFKHSKTSSWLEFYEGCCGVCFISSGAPNE